MWPNGTYSFLVMHRSLLGTVVTSSCTVDSLARCRDNCPFVNCIAFRTLFNQNSGSGAGSPFGPGPRLVTIQSEKLLGVARHHYLSRPHWSSAKFSLFQMTRSVPSFSDMPTHFKNTKIARSSSRDTCHFPAEIHEPTKFMRWGMPACVDTCLVPFWHLACAAGLLLPSCRLAHPLRQIHSCD